MRYTVYSRPFLTVILLFLSLLASCAGGGHSNEAQLPDPEDKAAWSVRYSEKAYITAWGVSTQSQQMARQNAQAAVAAAVRSSIESELTSVMESETRQGEIRDYQKLESITKTRTHFQHAELIHLVDQTAHHKKNEFWIMATLSRHDAVQELLIPYRQEAAPFRILASRLDSLQRDPPAFTTTWKKLKTHHRNMQPPAAEIRAVAGGQLPEIVNDEEKWLWAEKSRQNLMNNLQIAVLLKDHPELNHEELASRIGTALTGLGLTVVGESCRPGIMRLNINPEIQWTRIMGRVVQLELDGEFGFCDQEEPWNVFRIQDRSMRGEGRRPMEDLYERLESGFLSDYLYSIFEPYLPF